MGALELLLLFCIVLLHRDPKFSRLIPIIMHFQAAGQTNLSSGGTVYFVMLVLLTDFWGRKPFFGSFSSVPVLLLVWLMIGFRGFGSNNNCL